MNDMLVSLDPTIGDFSAVQRGLHLGLIHNKGPPSGGDRYESSSKIKGGKGPNS